MTVSVTSKLYSLLAEIVSYPTPELETSASDCAELLDPSLPEASREMRKFLALVEQMSLGRLEEVYTSTFDINPLCPPYVGYYLFGDTHKRGEFLVKLKKDYGVYDFSAEGELPDHLSVLLGFLAVLEDEHSARALISECMVPALEKMENKTGKDDGAYHSVMRAILLILRNQLETEPAGGTQNV